MAVIQGESGYRDGQAEVAADLGIGEQTIYTWRRQDYNGQRPHSSLGNLTPEEFARTAA